MRYNSIKRLYEADDVQQMPTQQMQPAQGMPAPAPIQPQSGMDIPMEVAEQIVVKIKTQAIPQIASEQEAAKAKDEVKTDEPAPNAD